MKKKLFIVDVSSWFFRAFYAVRPLSTASGLPTNAVYGYLQMVSKLIKEKNPEYIAFCYDRKEPSFRRDIDPNYKANRGEMPEELVPQMPYIKKVAPLMGIASFEKKGFEADDLIGTLCHRAEQWGLDVVIASGDKDFGQLINKSVTMLDTMKGICYDEKGVLEKWGIRPEQFIDYLALVGDASDNIPGVRGVGPKGAQKLIVEYETLDGIYKNLDKIKSQSVRDKLSENKENAYLSKKLVTIVTDIELNVELDDLKKQPLDEDGLRSFLKELEFEKLEKNLLNQKSAVKGESKKTKETAVVNKPQDKISLIERKVNLKELERLIDARGEYWVFNQEEDFVVASDKEVFLIEENSTEVKGFLSTQSFGWKGFGLKELWTRLEIKKPVAAWDSQVAAYVVRAGNVGDFAKVFEQYTGGILPDEQSEQEIGGSSLVNQVKNHILLQNCLRAELKKVGGDEIFQDMEMPLIEILYRMERAGVSLDVKDLKVFSEELGQEIARSQKKIWDIAGEEFNVASPKQLAVVLFDKLGLPPSKKTKTGYSTKTEVLNKLAKEHPICEKVLSFRENSKLKSTYVDALPQLVDGKTLRLHTTYNQALTTTGRLSSHNPNLQNIPIRTSKGHRVRRSFVAGKGQQLLSVDYSQIELRILAHITGDKGLIQAFENDLDIHAATASEVFSVSLDGVTPDLRRKAKAINFGIAYGQGAFGLAETLGVSRGESKEIITNYFEKFSGVSTYMTDIVESAKERGFVETLLGRRRYIDELKSSNGMIRKFGERAAINAPIQGTASDIIKKAMVELSDKICSKMILQVHDELIFEGSKDELKKDIPIIKEIMSGAVDLKVPLKVNVGVGGDWAQTH